MTQIFENPAVRAMRALVLARIDHIVWRHHGIGVLQGYICENVEPEIRIHIWSKRLLKPGMDVSGDVHDHRFDMISHVLVGSVQHEELNEKPEPDGDYEMLALTHARAAADTNYHGPTTPIAGRYTVERKLFTIPQGWSYSFPAQKFHHSPLPTEEIAVTCVEKHRQQDVQARLLYPREHAPIMAFGHSPDSGVIHDLHVAAKAALASPFHEVKLGDSWLHRQAAAEEDAGGFPGVSGARTR